MCGIAGRLNYLSGAPVDGAIVRRMCDLIGHRGPDGEGSLIRGPLGLGHRRLAIIDLSPAGRQPMATPDERLWIVFNGEIYNFQELRKDLEARGYHFRSRTDTEVLLAAYREFGVDCLSRLRGMFAFAIWDAEARSLFVARDRLGKKPLHYLCDQDGIAFASEPKAFLADPSFRAEPDLEALSHYLSYQYVPSPFSAFKGVRKLPPAHYLLIRDGQLETRRYWKLSYKTKLRIDEDDACRELLARLREAVALRLISDVPLGAFLSGGIDSSATVALMAEVGSAPVKTFSIGFDEEGYNELSYARLVATRYATDHHEFIIRPRAVEILPKLVWHYNEPFADESAIPTYYLSEMTRRHVKVALNGDAGDENFAGYRRYVADTRREVYRRLPPSLRTSLKRVARWLPYPQGRQTLLARGKRWLEAADQPYERLYARRSMQFDPELKNDLCTPAFMESASGMESTELILQGYRGSDAQDFLDATLDVDVAHYLPDCLLVKVDIATMAHGLEGRSPFLDHEFMEFAASLPVDLKLRGTTKKYILKKALKNLLPPEIVDRPKMGFGVPLEEWFRNDLKEMASDILLGRRLREREYFRPAAVERLFDEHVRGVATWHDQLWNLLMLELWHQMFIDRQPASEPPGIQQSLVVS